MAVTDHPAPRPTRMKTHRLVRPEDLNQYGHLFGGRLLAWVDEASWIAASLDHPGCRFVTIGMKKVSFHHAVQPGAILTIASELVKTGTTSVHYQVRVHADHAADEIFSTTVSFVNIDEAGNKAPLT